MRVTSRKSAQPAPLANEEIIRILYYDFALFNGTTRMPVSRTVQTHDQTTPYLQDLAQKDLFAVRRGVLSFGAT